MSRFAGLDDVHFVVVYQREPHARQMAFSDVVQPTSFGERCELARRTMAELNLNGEVWVDDMGDQSRALFGDLPNPAVVVDPVGEVRVKQPWMNPLALQSALEHLRRELPGEMTVLATGRTQHSPIGAALYQLADPATADLGRTNLAGMLALYDADDPQRAAAAVRLAVDSADPLANTEVADEYLRHVVFAALVEARSTDARGAAWLAELLETDHPLQLAWAWTRRRSLAKQAGDEAGIAATDRALRELYELHPWVKPARAAN